LSLPETNNALLSVDESEPIRESVEHPGPGSDIGQKEVVCHPAAGVAEDDGAADGGRSRTEAGATHSLDGAEAGIDATQGMTVDRTGSVDSMADVHKAKGDRGPRPTELMAIESMDREGPRNQL
jgi:hypothetical protein